MRSFSSFMNTDRSKSRSRTRPAISVTPPATLTANAEIDTYDDHRMAMCFSTLGLVVPGMRIRDPECVRKTFPGFYEKLAAPAPHGLGVRISHARSGRSRHLPGCGGSPSGSSRARR